MNQEQEFTSGMGKQSTVPPEIRGWNWGAFLLNWIWGIGNSTFIALLMFIPLVNLVMPFVLGAKGNEWAWQNRTWQSIEQFKRVQRKWAIAGLLIIVIVLPTFILGISQIMKSNDAFDISLQLINNHEEATRVLGSPISAGLFVTGNISTSGPNGEASLQYTVEGPRSEGEAYVFAHKELGEWKVHQLVIMIPELKRRIDVVTPVAQ
ncbi:MAG: hypothetical protein HUJ29_07220 [Gammaproteobacteria bacterium]|nr:hypothetical protein [Gammaproteobacteria bacterium]